MGGEITSDGRHEQDIKKRAAKGLQTMGRLRHIWNAKEIKISTKIQIYSTIIVPQMLYGSETWILKRADENRLLVAEMSCLRKILGVSRLQRIRNEDIRKRLGMKETIIDKIRTRRLRWYGHVNRMKSNRLPYKALYTYKEGKRGRGRPRKKWTDNIKEDLERYQMTIIDGMRLTTEKDKWKSFVSSYCR